MKPVINSYQDLNHPFERWMHLPLGPQGNQIKEIWNIYYCLSFLHEMMLDNMVINSAKNYEVPSALWVNLHIPKNLKMAKWSPWEAPISSWYFILNEIWNMDLPIWQLINIKLFWKDRMCPLSKVLLLWLAKRRSFILRTHIQKWKALVTILKMTQFLIPDFVKWQLSES